MAINFNPGLTAGSINTLNSVQRSSETNYQQLSTGQRINSAADDAAGLSIATRIDATSRALQQAVRNTNDGISMLQVADGALSESNSILTRMRELTIQSANGTYSESDRGALDKEYEQLADELSRIQSGASFNGKNLFNGEETTLQVGASAESTLSFNLEVENLQNLSGSSSLSVEERLSAIDDALQSVSDTQSDIGATINRLDFTSNQLNTQIESSARTYSQIMDTDYAAASAERARNDLQTQVALAVLAQANAQRENVLKVLNL